MVLGGDTWHCDLNCWLVHLLLYVATKLGSDNMEGRSLVPQELWDVDLAGIHLGWNVDRMVGQAPSS